MRLVFILLTLSLCTNAEAQLGIKPILKAGIRTYGSSKFLSYESEGLSKQTWYTYSASIYIPKFRTVIEGTHRENGRYAFIKTPNFLIKKPKSLQINRAPRPLMSGDTLTTYIGFYPSWLSFSFNVLPNILKKHQLLLGGGMIKRAGGLNIVDRVVIHQWGTELLIKSAPDVSQKSILWKTEYIYMPFKYSLLSFRCNYAYFTKFPHGYYEFILSLGTYIDL